MFQEMYNRMNEEILPDAALKDRVLNAAVPKRTAVLRPAVAVAVALAVVMLAVPVMAVCVPSAWGWIQNLTPISQETESVTVGGSMEAESVVNGIRMKVEGIRAEASEAQVLLRFEYEDGTPVEGIASPEQVYFDAYHTWYLTGWDSYYAGAEELLMLKFTAREGNLEEFYGSQINLIVDSLRLTEPEAREVPLALTDSGTVTVSLDAPEEPFVNFGVLAADGNEDYLSREKYTLIAPGEAEYDVTEEIGITGMCFIEGRLHIQLCQTVPYDTCSFMAWLEDADGNRVHEQVGLSFTWGEDGSISGREYGFDISPEALDDYRLMVEVEHGIAGPWKVSFELNE